MEFSPEDILGYKWLLEKVTADFGYCQQAKTFCFTHMWTFTSYHMPVVSCLMVEYQTNVLMTILIQALEEVMFL